MARGGQGSGKLEPISVYPTAEEKQLIEQLATLENRSVSNLLKTLALNEARRKGIVLEQKPKSDD